MCHNTRNIRATMNIPPSFSLPAICAIILPNGHRRASPNTVFSSVFTRTGMDRRSCLNASPARFLTYPEISPSLSSAVNYPSIAFVYLAVSGRGDKGQRPRGREHLSRSRRRFPSLHFFLFRTSISLPISRKKEVIFNAVCMGSVWC